MLKSRWVRILLALLLFWIIITAYFYYQRQVTVVEQRLNQKLTVGDCQLVFEEISFRNFDYCFNYRFDPPWFYDHLGIFPPGVQIRLSGILNFYHHPVEFSGDTGILELKGIAIYPQYQKDCSEWINLVDIYIPGYNSGTGSIYENTSNYIRFNIHAKNFPRQDLDKELSVVLEDKLSGENKSINIVPQWKQQKYNLLEKGPSQCMANPGGIARDFLELGEAGKREEALNMVVPEKRQDFPWPFTGNWNWEDNSQIHYFVQQHDNYEGFKDVYSVRLEKMSNKDGMLISECEQTVFLLEDNEREWQVIEISPFKYRSE